MKKYLVLLLVFLLTLSIFTITFAAEIIPVDEVSYNHSEDIVLGAPSCPKCMTGQLLEINKLKVGQTSGTPRSCYYSGCYVTIIYDVYQITYKCNSCGVREVVDDNIFSHETHTLKH